jgi:hypothetical protein
MWIKEIDSLDMKDLPAAFERYDIDLLRFDSASHFVGDFLFQYPADNG